MIDPYTGLNEFGGYGEPNTAVGDTVTTPKANPWDKAPGDPKYASAGQIHLRGKNNDQPGSEWAGGHTLKGTAGNATSFGVDENGLMRYGVDSKETAEALAKKYGGTIHQGYQGAEDFDLGGGSGVSVPGQSEKGWGYYYTPPGKSPEEQYTVGHEMGVLSDPSFMDKYGWVIAALFTGVGAFAAAGGLGAAAAGGTAGVDAAAAAGGAGGVTGAGGASLGATGAGVGGAAGTGAGVVGGIEGATGLGGEGVVGTEASMLGGPGVGTGTELTAEQMAAASLSPATQASIAKAAGMTEAQLAEYLASHAAPTYPGQGAPQYPTTPEAPVTPSTTEGPLSKLVTPGNVMKVATTISGLSKGSNKPGETEQTHTPQFVDHTIDRGATVQQRGPLTTVGGANAPEYRQWQQFVSDGN